MKIAAAIILLTWGLTGCNKNKLSPEEYVRYLEEEKSGFRVKLSTNDCDYILQYKPTDYIAARELRKEEILEQEISRLRAELDGLQYFTFSIVPKKASTGIKLFSRPAGEETNENYLYWSDRMQEDIYLVEGSDTLRPVLFHYEDTYGIKPSADWNIAFERNKQSAKADKIFVFNNRIADAVQVRIEITSEAINTIPTIITE
jgi:hypothetical protein